MSDSPASRREFLGLLAGGAGAVWLGEHWAAAREAGAWAAEQARSQTPQPFQVLTAAEAADFEAFAAQIIPTDDTPGAREAGVVYFLDHSLGGFAKDRRPQFTRALAGLRRSARSRPRGPAPLGFTALSPREQVAAMQRFEKDHREDFELLRTAVLMGFLANPEYGGNRNKTGWRLMGFEDRYSWVAPYGAYDRP